jgi:DNA-binding transcriptional ArsR family regulator
LGVGTHVDFGTPAHADAVHASALPDAAPALGSAHAALPSFTSGQHALGDASPALASAAPDAHAPAQGPPPPAFATILPDAAPDGAVVAAGALGMGLLLGAALYHLIDRKNILHSEARQQVLEVVARSPGASIHEVAQAVGLSHPTARYHLDLLQRNGLILCLDRGNKMLYFCNRGDFTPQERELVALLRSPEAWRVYDTIASRPWIVRRELSDLLGISRTSVNWHLRGLMEAGLVVETREQGKGFLFASREGREVVERVARRVASLGGALPAPAEAPEAPPPAALPPIAAMPPVGAMPLPDGAAPPGPPQLA